VQTVLPPGYLCCGYPQRGSGQYDKAEKIITDNRVLFHRVANTLNYLDIKTVVVSCGTCYDQLQAMSSTRSSRLPHHRHPRVPAGEGHQARRRDGHALHVPRPCHTPMKTRTRSSRQRADGRGEGRLPIEKNDRCCGESGTLAVTRPDISTQVRFRKEEEIRKGAAKLRAAWPTRARRRRPRAAT
jgi:Fe-S oxidoreductase